jgi:hypothetical protein
MFIELKKQNYLYNDSDISRNMNSTGRNCKSSHLAKIINYRKEIKPEISGAILLAIRLFYIADCHTQMMKIDNIELLFVIINVFIIRATAGFTISRRFVCHVIS